MREGIKRVNLSDSGERTQHIHIKERLSLRQFAARTAIITAIGVPPFVGGIYLVADLEANRIINEGIQPAQEDVGGRVDRAKTETKSEMEKNFSAAQDAVIAHFPKPPETTTTTISTENANEAASSPVPELSTTTVVSQPSPSQP